MPKNKQQSCSDMIFFCLFSFKVSLLISLHKDSGKRQCWLASFSSFWSANRGEFHDALALSYDLIIPLNKGGGGFTQWKACGHEALLWEGTHVWDIESMKFMDNKNEEVQFPISASLSKAKL